MSHVKKMPGHLIRRLNQISVAIFSEKMSGSGFDLTPVQYAALEQIKVTPEIDQTTLAKAIAYDKVTIGGVVDRLRNKGLVSREPSETDRRARVLKLTDTGEAVLAKVRPIVAGLQENITENLTVAERDQLVILLEKAVTPAK